MAVRFSDAQPAGVPVVPLAAPTIERVDVRGQQRVEAETIRLQLGSKPGRTLDPLQVRDDIRSLWKLGVFSHVGVFVEPVGADRVVLAFEVAERPTIRKVLVAGNDDVKLDKIDDVIELRRDAVIDMPAVRKSRDKILELYLQEGYSLAAVEYELVAAGAGQVDVKFVVDEHAKIRVADITFVGNRSIGTDELRSTMITRTPNALSFLNNSGVYRRDALERDVAMLHVHYLDRGFATVKIGTPALKLSRDRRHMHVTINIDEGPRFQFGAIDVKGDLIGSAPQHLARLAGKPNTTFSRATLERDRKTLETYYQDLGYAQVTVTPRHRIDHASRRIPITFEIVRGRRVYVERIHVRGNSKTRDKVIRRELKISEGELYSGSKLEHSRRRVIALGHFENVTVSTTRGSSDEFVEVNVEVIERQTGTIQLGAGFSSYEKFLVQGQIAYDNFLGRGQSVAFQAQLSSLRRLFSFRFIEPRFLDTDWMLGLELYNQSRGIGTFSRNSTGGALTWGYSLTDNLRALLTYRLENVGIEGGSGGIANFGARTTELPALDSANLLRGGLTSSVRASLAWDSRDNRLFPTGGWYANVFAEYAGRLTGSENQFVRWGGFARRYQRLGGPFVLRLNAELGVTTSLDGRGVPLTERYLLGGIYDVRGYQQRTLGPRLFTQARGDVGQELDPLALGGNLQLIGNAEVEFPLVRKLGISGVVFFDVGNSYNLERRFCTGATLAPEIDPCASASSIVGGLRKSIGAGIRWQSPFGPLRLEWGIPLDLQKGERPSGLDFTIGTSF